MDLKQRIQRGTEGGRENRPNMKAIFGMKKKQMTSQKLLMEGYWAYGRELNERAAFVLLKSAFDEAIFIISNMSPW